MTPLHHDEVAEAAQHTMSTLPRADADAPTGAPLNYRPNRTLPVLVELRRQWSRRRTQFALAVMTALPLILAVAFRIGSDRAGPSSTTFIDLAQSSAANFVMVALFFSANFLLIVVVSLYFGDMVASEASWSSLKYLLTMPVPRARLLRQKIVVAAMLTAASLVLLAGFSFLVGWLLYGTGAMTTPTGDSFTGWDAAWRLVIAVIYIGGQLIWVAGLATLMTVVTDVPLGAVGSAVLLSIVSQILDQITALGDLRNYLPTHFSFGWVSVMANPPDWADVARGTFMSVSYGAVLIVCAFVVFRRKDITS